MWTVVPAAVYCSEPLWCRFMVHLGFPLPLLVLLSEAEGGSWADCLVPLGEVGFSTHRMRSVQAGCMLRQATPHL